MYFFFSFTFFLFFSISSTLHKIPAVQVCKGNTKFVFAWFGVIYCLLLRFVVFIDAEPSIFVHMMHVIHTCLFFIHLKVKSLRPSFTWYFFFFYDLTILFSSKVIKNILHKILNSFAINRLSRFIYLIIRKILKAGK